MATDEPAVTMKVLAQHLGVSVATVSNAFSRPDQLSTQLRRDILAAADQLGYPGPHAAGRALRSGRHDVCGFLYGGELASTFLDPYSVLFLAGLSESVEAARASVLLLRATDGDDSALRRAAIDAVVAPSANAAGEQLAILRARGVRVVGTQRAPSGDWVAIDNVEAGRLVARHLAGLGHRDVTVIAPVNAPVPVAEPAVEAALTGYLSDRVAGIREVLPSVRVRGCGGNTREAGRQTGAVVLDVQHRPSALIALSDLVAFGVADAVRQRGLTLGGELSLAGFDDLPDAAYAGLTTVRQPIREKGWLAGRLAMDPDLPERQVTLPIELVVRHSTGPAQTLT